MVSGNGNAPMIADDDLSLDEFQEKAQLDTEELADPSFDDSPEDKVELDLEDAPFLLEDEDEEEEPEDLPPSTDLDLDATPETTSLLKKLLENRKLLYIVIAVILLLILSTASWLFLREAPRPQPVPQPQKIIKQIEPEQEKPKAPEYIVTWDPFWVELKDSNGNLRFLQCQFSAPTDNEKLSWEAASKKVVLRDAIFYYLRNKSLLFLSDKTNVEILKTDILAVINQYMNNGQFEELLIESYLVK